MADALAAKNTEVASSRAGYLRCLNELIGEAPAGVSWDDEEPWFELRTIAIRIMTDDERRKFWETWSPDFQDADRLEWLKQTNAPELIQRRFRQSSIDDLIKRGWAKGDARCYAMLSHQGPALAEAMRQQPPQAAACVYALCDCIWRNRKGPSSDDALPPMLFRHLRGFNSLARVDPKWEKLETPDRTGFRGLCSNGITVADCDPDNFGQDGYRRRFAQGGEIKYITEDSPVVGFVSRDEDATGAHSAVLTYTETTGMFPPNTLFRLKEVKEPGTWRAPGNVYPKQWLLVVTATFLPPPRDYTIGVSGEATAKLCPAPITLSYGNRASYTDGIDELISKPLLTLEQEFGREYTWQDWKGVSYSLKDEWKYVNGPAVTKMDCTPGTRDKDNNGLKPEAFRKKGNDWISEQRKKGIGEQFPEALAKLTLDEVLAIRLYSGPAYQPINNFMRQVAGVSGEFRKSLAMNPGLTFTATVSHICSAIRKLAAHTSPDEAKVRLYRGVRGVLEAGFWHSRDSMGMLVAVDMAFMSTSKNKHTPIDYMKPGKN
eukprot:2278515-Prymnesium_polylepis.1